MNPLSISVTFVICSILLSFLKHTLYPSEPSSSVMKFERVVRLARTPLQPTPQHYGSLYEAYHRTETLDSQKYTSMIDQHYIFNQTVLRDSYLSEEESRVCGSSHLVLVRMGLVAGGWLSVVRVYRLPLLGELGVFRISGRVRASNECASVNDEHRLGLVTKKVTLVVSMRAQLAWLGLTDVGLSLQAEVGGFAMLGAQLAYWSKDEPWQVKLADYSITRMQQPSAQVYDYDPTPQPASPIVINLLQPTPNSTTHSLDTLIPECVNTFLGDNRSHIALVWTLQNLTSHEKSLYFSSYSISPVVAAPINKFSFYSSPSWMPEVEVQCRQSGAGGISCMVGRGDELSWLVVEDWQDLQGVYGVGVSHRPKEDQQGDGQGEDSSGSQSETEQKEESEQEEMEWMLNLGQDEDDNEDATYDQFGKRDQQARIYGSANSSQTTQWSIRMYTFSKPLPVSLRILKASSPDPILYYCKDSEHFLFSFNLPKGEEPSFEATLESANFALSPPDELSSANQSVFLRDLGWIEEENLVLVLWSGCIEVYEYECYHRLDDTADGVAMSVIMPFIEVFATVFCLLRMMWSSD